MNRLLLPLLLACAALSAQEAARSGIRVEQPTGNVVEAPGLPFDASAGNFLGGIEVEGEVTAIRFLAFPVAPGEKLVFRLKSDNDKVRMAVYPSPKAAAQAAAIRKANMPLSSVRAKHLEYTNTSKEPFRMLLMLHGVQAHAYRLEIERVAPEQKK